MSPPSALRVVDGTVMLCAENDVVSEAPLDGDPAYDCKPASLPAVVDCDDAALSEIDLIGTCEAVRAPAGPLPASLVPQEPTGKKQCTPDRCGFERSPVTPPTPTVSGHEPALLPSTLPYVQTVSREAAPIYLVRSDAGVARGLERPPRA